MTAIWNDPSRSVDERTEALLAELTLEEKAGQLGSYWLRPETNADAGFAPMQATFDEGRSTFDALAEHGLGHITRPFGSGTVSPADGVAHLRRIQAGVLERSRLGIPAIAHEECLTGFMASGATTYPAAIAWGASFSPELVHEMARRIGHDMRAVGTHLGLSPVLDIVRDYRWGRIEETMGEDPYLTGILATEYVRGLQESHVLATLKHFVGHAASRAGRNHAPVSIGRRELADIDLIPFEMAVKLGGAGAVMNSYADLDGVPPAGDRWLLTELLRGDWGFTGTVVSDYWAVSFLESMHRVATDPKDAAAIALHAGMDVELPETNCFVHLAEAVREGTLAPEDLDEAARRVLRQKIELGLLDDGFDAATDGESIDLDSADNRAVARQLAEQSVILLSNDGTLPLTDVRRVAIIGPNATDGRSHLGCYSFTNHVLARLEGGDTSVDVPTIADSLIEELDGVEVLVERGVDVLDPDVSGVEAAVSAARDADVAVVVVGDRAGLFGTGTSGEGCDVVDLALPGKQADLVEAVLASGTPVVLVLVTGRPYALGAFVDRCAAIVQAFMPGEEGGPAVAGALSGRVNPSGHLPIGIPSHVGGQPGTYLAPRLAWESEGISNLDPRPLFPFGHGLSYATFELSDLVVDSTEIPNDGEVTAQVMITNTSDREGTELVQLYLSDPVASVVRPLKRLVGFTRVELAAGRSARVAFRLHADRTAFTGRGLRRIVEPGDFVLRAGTSSEGPGSEARFAIIGDVRETGEDRVLVTPVEITQV